MNQVNLIGRLTKDPELRKTSNGNSYIRFTLAVNRLIKDDKGNSPTADFISCVAWRQTADAIANFCNKGSQIGITGSIETGSYEGQNGKIYTTDVLVDRMYLLDTRNKPNNTQGYQEEKVPFNNTGIIDISDEDLPFY